MHIEYRQLEGAAEAGILSRPQAERLWAFLMEANADNPGFRFTHVLYYLGGLIAIGAMSLFMNEGWERFGGWGLFGITAAYALLGLALTHYFLARRHLKIPAGIMAAFVVALTPLAIYALQEALGFWAEGRVYRDYHYLIDWRWIMMEFGTLAAGAALFRRYRMPFMLMPVAVTLWYMSMDLTPFLFGGLEGADYWDARKYVSLWFGLLMTLLALWVDLRSRHSEQDYAFWLYLFGVLTFWGGLSSLNSDSELGKFLYFCINLFLIFTGAALSRRVFAVFGALGAAGYVGHLAWDVFRDSLLFPVVLSFIGFGVIGLGILWQRHEARIHTRAIALLPRPLAELIARRNDTGAATFRPISN